MKNTKWIVMVITGIILAFIIQLLNPSRTGHAYALHFFQTAINLVRTPPLLEGENEERVGGVSVVNSTNPNLDKSPTKKLILKNKTINLIVTETPHERQWGLSDFPSLPPDTGMMFQFDTPGIYPFWMKDMRFALDMIWLDSDNRVITIHENISPDTYYKNPPELFQSTSPASAVIEVPGGFVEKNNLSVGDRLQIR